MIESKAFKTPTYVYGGVLYQRVSDSDALAHPSRVGFATCISQGVLTGSVMMFLFWLILSAAYPAPGFDHLTYFPLALIWGVFAGSVEGVIIWLCTRVAGHNLLWFTRAATGALVASIPYFLMLCLVIANAYGSPNLAPYVLAFLIPATIGALFGVFTGSRFDAWRELVRGMDSLPPSTRFLTGLTGLVLRLAIIFCLMESILAITVALQPHNFGTDVIFFGVLLLHFATAFPIVFVRMKFGKLLPLAIIINFTLAGYMSEWFYGIPAGLFNLYVCYVIAWGLFLITRCSQTYKALAVLKEEIRYYLID